MQFSGHAGAERHETGSLVYIGGGNAAAFEHKAADVVYLPVSYPFFLGNS